MERKTNQSGDFIALLTGGSDKPYVYGLTRALTAKGTTYDLIGSDELECPEVADQPGIRFFNLRGSQDESSSAGEKFSRIAKYYARLIWYAGTSKPKVFHILWNNKFQHIDRTLLMLYYKLLGKRIVLTAHNVNKARRDSVDSHLNRFTLGVQYKLSDCIFVHTDKAKEELMAQFGVRERFVKVIPFGVNNAVPNTAIGSDEAKTRLGLKRSDKVLLFFGRITPYKGLENLVDAFRTLVKADPDYKLIIAGRPELCEEYWNSILQFIQDNGLQDRVLVNAGFIPDDQVELYFKAADILILPYQEIYQSGVLFLGYSFGLPAVATDVGSFSTDIEAGVTGYLCKPRDPADLARTVEKYFDGDLYRRLCDTRQVIRDRALRQNSWEIVAEATSSVYAELQRSAKQ